MNPFRQQRAVSENDLLFNGLLTAMLGLIVKAQTGAGLHPLEQPVAAPIGEPANGARLIPAERTRHGHLASRG
jgi:hypothetical protein